MQAINSKLLESSINGASRVLFSIAGGPDLTLSEVDAAARTMESVVDENANIIYGQIIDETLGDQVRITVIATGFTRNTQAAMDFGTARNDLYAAAASMPVRETLSANTSHAASPAASLAGAYGTPSSFGATAQEPAPTRVADEEYIPEFLRRR